MIGTTHAEDVESLVNRVIERGLRPSLLREIDVVVFPRQVGGDRYVSRVVELLSADEYEALDPDATHSSTGNPKHGGAGVIDKGETTVYYNTVAWRTADGEFRFPGAPVSDASATSGVGMTSSQRRERKAVHTFARLAARTDREVDAVATEFAAKRRYVEYLVREGVDDADDLFEFLADLRTDEAATVERAARTMRDQGSQTERGTLDADDTQTEHERGSS